MGATTLLDCTLRDGGNVNEWRFERRLVHRLVKAVAAAGVDVVEVGYVGGSGSHRGSDVGLCANVTAELLAELERISPRLAVMVVPTVCPPRLLEALADSAVDVIRVAAYPENVDGALPFVESAATIAHATLNVMAASRVSPDELAAVARRAAAAGASVVYFADSFGSLNPLQVQARVRAIRAAAPVAVGFHGHDNLGLAFANCLAALDAGAEWIDASICGMARGAGNLATEQLAGVARGWPELGLDVDVTALLDLSEEIQASVLPGPMPRTRRELETGLYDLHYYDHPALVEVSAATGIERDLLARNLPGHGSARLDRAAVERTAAALATARAGA